MTARIWLVGISLLVSAGLALLFWPAGKEQPSTASSPTSAAASHPAPDGMSPAPPSSSPRGGEVEDHDHAPNPARSAQLALVDRFATLFASDRRQSRWLGSLRPLVTADLLAGFEFTDPRTRPRGRVVEVSHLEPGDLYQVTYDTGDRIACRLVRSSSGGWVVASVDPVQVSLPSGTDV